MPLQHQQKEEQAEAAKERLKRLNDLVARESRTSIDQTSSDEDNDKVIENVIIFSHIFLNHHFFN